MKVLSLALVRLWRELSWKKAAAHYGVNWKAVAAAIEDAGGAGIEAAVITMRAGE